MALTIWKYEIEVAANQRVPMQVGARILAAQFQQGNLCLWAEVDSALPVEMRHIVIYGTGHEMPPASAAARTYISTVQQGVYVWHVYEARP